MKIKYSFILPTYNEKDNIIPIIQEIEDNFRDFEILVIDDNSLDNTAAITQSYSKGKPYIKTVIPQKRLGLTRSIKYGISQATGYYIIWLDVDGTMHPKLLKDNLHKFEDEDFDVIFFSRYVENAADSRTEKLSVALSIIINRLCQLLLSSKHKDYTSGFVGVKQHILKSMDFTGDYGEYFIELLYKLIKQDCKILEAPYILTTRQKGETKTAPNYWVLIKRGLKYLFKILTVRFSK